MKKIFLSFEAAGALSRRGHAPKIESRRMGLSPNRNGNVAYKSDGDEGGGDSETPEAKLLSGILVKVREELQTRGYQNQASVESLIKTALDGVDVENLKKFDAAKIELSVRNIAAELEKVKNVQVPGQAQKLDALRTLLDNEKTMQTLERAFKSREGYGVTLSVRAAQAVMTIGNTIPAEDIPEDILHSFSVDTLAKKRRPKEYIYDIANRRTVASVTEYKTWLEEGDEEGAFALVLEGAVKPLVSKTLVRNHSKVRKVAGKRVYTEEFAKFRKEIYGILEELFNDQLMRNYASILMVDLIAAAAGYVGTALDDQIVAPTDYHAIGAVAAQIETLDFQPDILIIHPQDKWRMSLAQTSDGQFFINIPQVDPSGVVNIMGFRVVTTTRIAVGEFMLGESNLYKIEDEPVTVRMGYGINVTKDGTDTNVIDVSSDFDNNRFRIIAETFFHDYIATPHIGSFVKTTFAAVKAALLKP